jgi:hypothetical protein
MCNPMVMAVGGFLVSGAQAVMGYMGEKQEYKKQEEYRQQNIANANENARQQYNQTLTRMGQEGDAMGIAKAEAAREARAARATATVAAGESGISGLSVDALMNDFYGREGTYADQLDQQNDWTNTQLQYEMRGIQANAIDRANSVPQPTKPNFMGAALRIAGAGLNGFGSYRNYTA